jgi:hypothetical protein
MIYLFHNVYGDADDLIAAKPVDCEAVPFGWTPEIEEYRNNLIVQLGCTISALPSVVYYQEPYTTTITDIATNEVTTIASGGKWEEIAVLHMDTPWTWSAIQEEIKRDKNKTITVDSGAL